MQSAEATSSSKTGGHCQRCLNGCDLWKLKERNSREKKTLTVLDILDEASGLHIAPRVPNLASHTPWKTIANGWLRWAGAPKCLRVHPHRARSARTFLIKSKDAESLRTLFLLKLTGTWSKVENHARYLRMIGNRTMGDSDIDEANFQQLLDEFTDAKNKLLHHNGY